MTYHKETHTQQVLTGWYTKRESMDSDYHYPPKWCGPCNGSSRKHNDPQPKRCTSTRDHFWRGPVPGGASASEAKASYLESDAYLDQEMYPGKTRRQARIDARRYEEMIVRISANEVMRNGRLQCPGGCDLYVGGCIVHADNC